MKTKFIGVLSCALLSLNSAPAAPLGSTFTSQGRLTEAGTPANGHYDLRFVLYDSDSGGTVLMRLDKTGNLYTTGAVNPPSDRNAKENFRTVDAGQVLEKVKALAVTEWNYKEGATARHLGPVAQDFQAALGLGSEDKHIATVDADGVALAAIQGLNRKLEEAVREKDARIAALERNMAELQRLVSSLAQETP